VETLAAELPVLGRTPFNSMVEVQILSRADF